MENIIYNELRCRGYDVDVGDGVSYGCVEAFPHRDLVGEGVGAVEPVGVRASETSFEIAEGCYRLAP